MFLLKIVQLIKHFLWQFHREQVALYTFWSDRLGQYDITSLNVPRNQNLSWCDSKIVGDLLDVFKVTNRTFGGSQWRVSLNTNVVLLQQFKQFWLSQQWVSLNLVNNWHHINILVGQQTFNLLWSEVGNTDCSDFLGVLVDFLQLLVSVKVVPVWVLLFSLRVSGNRPVNQVQVDVVNLQSSQRSSELSTSYVCVHNLCQKISSLWNLGLDNSIPILLLRFHKWQHHQCVCNSLAKQYGQHRQLYPSRIAKFPIQGSEFSHHCSRCRRWYF
ncbi:hypothetical protein PGUG_02237 [Meyerozyma guilliermondii ATCC 6260]|uniref:Uncharacterized protein n=1 Tax=Meyerozyma guilliermondii (strain ATCC 6260 / CBS 566 / DSM 6381 / JCM 1539 / NBRC 10279 / NRRL Y-324) TaxID=294746 RepID=A5DG36_PICGU|nr:uncharacterized protein PGUG_02237 [Meyerozyma guilliermondii ATCC 6260]EDK38139.2 hypothetical protein PGUG_02237 [Meyerozyma guilliermondii ATCC 6260]